MEYKIAEGEFSSGLTEKVNEYLKEGWELYGNPYSSEGGYIHYQAIIKRNKDKKEI